PKWRVRVKEEHREEKREMKNAGQQGQDIPAAVSENLRVGRDSFYADVIGIHSGEARAISKEGRAFATPACILLLPPS
ncbi:MAG: hypothetical protein M3Q89_14395, partial [Verrucomicrobiota bacterium]|nr:hypothetical protein [Verrucomicrobiota bacterium]